MLRLVCFELAGRPFGSPIADVKETLAVKPLTRVFLTPAWVAGIINLRGDVVPVIDLAAFLGLGQTTPTPDTRILLARSGERVAGVLVDRLAEVRSFAAADLAPPPASLDDEVTALLAGVVRLPDGAPLAVLDLAKLLASPRLRVRERERT